MRIRVVPCMPSHAMLSCPSRVIATRANNAMFVLLRFGASVSSGVLLEFTFIFVCLIDLIVATLLMIMARRVVSHVCVCVGHEYGRVNGMKGSHQASARMHSHTLCMFRSPSSSPLSVPCSPTCRTQPVPHTSPRSVPSRSVSSSLWQDSISPVRH